jgi:hypothetical protein
VNNSSEPPAVSANSGGGDNLDRTSVTGNAGDLDEAVAIVRNYLTCEFTTVFRDGMPQTWPVSAMLMQDGRLMLCTSIGFPQKVFNVRRNHKVSLLFSEPLGSGLSGSGAVLICGDAAADNKVISDMTATPELAALVRTIFERQPSSTLMSSFVGRRMFWPYYLRLTIYVTPARAWYWPTKDFATEPKALDVKELCRVASGS